MSGALKFAADMTSRIFMNPDFVAEVVNLYPGGSRAFPTNIQVTAVVDLDILEGTQDQLPGDGRELLRRNDRKIRANAIIEFPAGTDIDDTRNPADRVQYGTEWYVMKRILGRDPDGIQALFVNVKNIEYARSSKRG